MLICRSGVESRVSELSGLAGFTKIATRLSADDILAHLEPEPERSGDLVMVVSDDEGVERVRTLDRRLVRYWLLFVGDIPQRWAERLPRSPQATVSVQSELGWQYLWQTLDDWRDRDLPRIDCFHFSYRGGAPSAADWVVDTRFLRSPHWVDELRVLGPGHEAVTSYVTGQSAAEALLAHFTSMLLQFLPFYVEQRRTVIRVGVGCTGGRHRSQTIVEALVGRLNSTGVVEARRLLTPPAHPAVIHSYELPPRSTGPMAVPWPDSFVESTSGTAHD